MKKILYINYILQYGHINFDLIHIKALRKQGFDVKVVVYDCVAQRMSLPDNLLLFTIPNWLDRNTTNGIINRIMYILTLLYIRMHVRKEDYERIIVSNIDEVSLSLVPLCDRMLIFTHSPHAIFKSKIKAYFMRRLAKNNTFLVFNESMKTPFMNAGINCVKVVSHGCMPAYSYHDKTSIAEYVRNAKRVIFHPSNCPNQQFLQQLLNDTEIQHTLEELDAIILMRDKSDKYKSKDRIRIISDYLSDEIYQNILLRSDVILLAYPDDFLYRVSGVSYECLANKKKMLILDNPSFYYCRDFYVYDPMFATIGQLSVKLRNILTEEGNAAAVIVESVLPDYSSLLNKK